MFNHGLDEPKRSAVVRETGTGVLHQLLLCHTELLRTKEMPDIQARTPGANMTPRNLGGRKGRDIF